MNIRELFPGIIGYSDLIQDPMSLVSAVEEVSLNSLNNDFWRSATAAADGDYQNIKVDNNIRSGYTFSLSNEIHENPNPDIAKLAWVRDKMYEITKPAVNHYKSKYYTYDAVDYFGWVMLKYNEGDFFVGHTDASHDFPRQVSLVFYNNDNYEGGELEFPHINLKIKALAGELIIFPANYLFLHSANKVTKGTKYSTINFIN